MPIVVACNTHHVINVKQITDGNPSGSCIGWFCSWNTACDLTIFWVCGHKKCVDCAKTRKTKKEKKIVVVVVVVVVVVFVVVLVVLVVFVVFVVYFNVYFRLP